MRIYQAAQHLGVKSTDLLELLRANGVDVKSPASTLDDATLQLAEKLIRNGATVPAEPTPAKIVAPVVAEPVPIPSPKAGKVNTLPRSQAKGKAEAAEPIPANLEIEPAVEIAIPETVPEPIPEPLAQILAMLR